MWVHGDVTVNNPGLYDEAMSSMRNMLLSSPKEPNVLFALEEFFVPISPIFSNHPDYQETVGVLHDYAKDIPGLQLRTSYLLSEEYEPSTVGLDQIKQRVMGKHKGTKIEVYAAHGQYLEALSECLVMFYASKVFNDRRSLLWTMRDILLLNPNLAQGLYEALVPLVIDKRDGDLVRIAIVVLGNSVLLNPVDLSKRTLETTSRFVDQYDIDGSQIIMLQTLLPLTKIKQTQKLVSKKKSYFASKAANKSVIHAVEAMF
jgi:hypothetical protein